MKNIKDFNSFILEGASEDEKKYLSPKQRKLPDGLKAGIIKANKKKGIKAGEDDKEEECKKCKDGEKCDDCKKKDKK